MSEPKSTSMFGSHGASNGCVMVVEDEPEVRDEMEARLQETGYDVISVGDGEKAMEMINWGENPLAVDVIITDVDKPNGMEAVNYFRRQFSTIPLIGLTGLPRVDRDPVQAMRVVILGAGKGGLALLNLFERLPGVDVLGIADIDDAAPALSRARDLDIRIADNPLELVEDESVNVIVDVTGDPTMEVLIAEQKYPSAEILTGGGAKLLWRVAQHEARMQTQMFNTEKLAHMVEDGVFVNYLVKPVVPESLIESVARAMERREIHRL